MTEEQFEKLFKEIRRTHVDVNKNALTLIVFVGVVAAMLMFTR